MDSESLRIQHIKNFSRLSLSERLAWSYSHAKFLYRFMDKEAKRINQKIRREGKKYFGE